ncbi:MAG: tetratricopeptide repeat protein [Planctomycetes bacterium]|nr:tetratricopeptide repeat protein [Planctomycetota bacterium]
MSKESTAEPGAAARLRWLGALAVLAAALLPFWTALGFPFLTWDDDINFTLNDAFRGLDAEHLRWMWTSFHAGHYMPLSWMSAALDYELAGLDARMFHATNLALHAMCALFLFLALDELLARCGIGMRRTAAAALGACFFAAHPLRVESVVWLTERRDVLSGAFLALAAWSWIRAQRPLAARSRWLGLSILAFAASLLSKVAGLGFPLVLLALDAWPLRRQDRLGWRPLLVEKLPYLALALGGAALGMLGQRYGTQVLADLDARPVAERVAISTFAFRSYLRHTLLPLGLSPFYELPAQLSLLEPRYLASLVFVLASSVFLFLRRRSSDTHAALWTAWWSFGVLVAPVIGIVHAGHQIAADRYTYLPSFALAGLAAAALVRWRGPAALLAGASCIVALGFTARATTAHWSDTRTLFERVVAIEPESYLGHHKLGVLLHQAGESQDALEHFDRALALRPELPQANLRYDRALARMALERDGALDDIERALDEQPAHAGALRLFAQEGERRFGRTTSEVDLRIGRALAHSGPPLVALELAARRALDKGQNELGLRHALDYTRLAPDAPLGHRLVGRAALFLGEFQRARESLELSCALGPCADAHYELGLALERLGEREAARSQFRRALELDPAHQRAAGRL